MTTLTDLTNEINAQFVDNATAQITPAKLRSVLADLVTRVEADISGISSGTGGGNTYNVSGGNPVFNTYADARTAVLGGTVAAGVKSFWTAGYYTPGDRGKSFYVDVGSTDPTLATSLPLVYMPVGEPAILQDTTNNRFFMMSPVGGEVWVEQFGARQVGWLETTYNATPYFHAAQRYLLHTQLTDRGYTKIRVGPGSWYMATPFEMKGGVIAFEASYGSWLHNAKDKPAIVLNGQWTFGADGVTGFPEGWSRSKFYTAGIRIGRPPGASAGAGNVYLCLVGGNSAATGNGPSGTDTSIIDGGVTWTYDRPFMPDEYYNDRASAFSVTGVNCYSLWNSVTDSYGKNLGIHGRNRGVVRDCFCANQSGHGMGFIANGDSSFPNSTGNVNGWRFEDVVAYWNGWSGIRVGYSDGNAGHGIGIDVSSNGWFGVDDNTFLQATWVDLQSAYDGNKSTGAIKEHRGQVTYNGRLYYCRVEQTGLEASPLDYTTLAPDVSRNWLLFYGSGTEVATSAWPAWSPTGVYEPGGAYCGRDVNSRSTWIGCYVELGTGPTQFAQRHIMIGGLINGSPLAPFRGYHWSDGAWKGPTTQFDAVYVHPTKGGLLFTSAIGAEADNKVVNYWQDWDGNGFALEGFSPDGYNNLDYRLRQVGTDLAKVYEITGRNTLKGYGRTTANPGAMRILNFVLGSDETYARTMDMSAFAPVSGYHAQGEIVWNSAYNGSNTNYWRCTASGTPGTWTAHT